MDASEELDTTETSGRPPRSLGMWAVRAGVLSAEQLQEAYLEWRETGEAPGEVFVRRGWMTERVVPFSTTGAWFNLPAVVILFLCTTVLVIGIRESAASNTALVLMKLGVVLFVIAAGVGYINFANYTDIPAEERRYPENLLIPDLADALAKEEAAVFNAAKQWSLWYAEGKKGEEPKLDDIDIQSVVIAQKDGPVRKLTPADAEGDERGETLKKQALAEFRLRKAMEVGDPKFVEKIKERVDADRPTSQRDRADVEAILKKAKAGAPAKAGTAWGLFGVLGLHEQLAAIDDATRSNFMPYGLSGVMLGAALVFFAYIGFDSISTHSEEAIKPQRDVPFGILASLLVCTILYMLVAAVITGMVPYFEIDTEAAVASAFTDQAKKTDSLDAAHRRRTHCGGGTGRHDERLADYVLEPGANLPGNGPRRPHATVDLRAPCMRDSARHTFPRW